MNDDQLKREIEEALSVEPSPQFAARVRARIASPPPSLVGIRWGVAAAGFALAGVVTAGLFLQPKETVIPRPVKMARKAPEKIEAPPMPTPERPIAVHHVLPPPSAPTTAEPEVLFDPRELAAFQRFVEGVQEDRIDLTKLIELQQAAAKPAPIEEIALMPIGDLEPIVIESLTFGARRIEGGSL